MAARIILFTIGCVLAGVAFLSLRAIWSEPRVRPFGFMDAVESFWKVGLVLVAAAGVIAAFATALPGG